MKDRESKEQKKEERVRALVLGKNKNDIKAGRTWQHVGVSVLVAVVGVEGAGVVSEHGLTARPRFDILQAGEKLIKNDRESKRKGREAGYSYIELFVEVINFA